MERACRDPGAAPSGRSNSSRPASSRNVTRPGRRRSTTSHSRVRPHHAWTSIDAGRPERAQIAEDERVEVRPVGRRRSPSHASIEVWAIGPLRPHRPRGGTWMRGTVVRTGCSSANRSRSGQRVSRWSPSALNVRGSASTNARPIATTSSGSTPTRRLPNWPFWTRSMTGWTSGRRPQASRAVTRWIVPRMSASRTTRRSTMRSDRSSGSKSCEPGPQGRVPGVRGLRLEPDEMLDGVRDRQRRAFEQELPRQRRSIERTQADPVAAGDDVSCRPW